MRVYTQRNRSRYQDLRKKQRAWESAQRAGARAAARRVVPPTPQPLAVEARRAELVLPCESAVEKTRLVQVVKALLECQEGEALSDIHLRGHQLRTEEGSKPPPVPLCPTLIHSYRLGGFKLPTSWTRVSYTCTCSIAMIERGKERERERARAPERGR